MGGKLIDARCFTNCLRAIFAASMILSFSKNALSAQDQSNAIVQKTQSFYYIQLSDGRFRVNTLPVNPSRDYGDEVKFLEHPSIQEELDLTEKQEQKLKKRIIAFKEEIQEAIKRSPSNSQSSSKEFVDGLQNCVEEFKTDLDTIFLPHQQQRIKELTVRFAIRRDGIRQTLESPKVSELLNFSLDQRNQSLTRARELAQELEGKTKSLRTELLKKIEGSLSSESRQIFDSTYKTFVEQRLPALDAVVWQASNVDILHKRLVDDSAEGENYFGLFINLAFSVDAAGRLVGESHSRGFSKESLKRIGAETVPVHKFIRYLSLMTSLRSPEVFDGLDLTPDQSEQLEQLHLAYEKQEDVLMERRGELTEQGKYSIEVRKLEMEERAKAGEIGLAEIDKILLPPQKEALNLISEGAEFIFGGFSYAIEYGNAAKRLKVSADDKKKVREVVDQFCKKVNEETKDWEQQAIDRLLKVLNEEQREKFNALIGPPLKYTGCNIDLFIAQLQSTGQ
jgi:Spy/CpxP family protein refolding chaperone